jgi:hypothetical protein
MYYSFDTFLIRTPHLPFNYLTKKWVGEKLYLNSVIQEAIYIASPILHSELQKLINNQIKTNEKSRIFSSFYKYISRMATRCTPFGLFAGCTLGKVCNTTDIILGDKIDRHTRLDMHYLCSLSQELTRIPEIRKQMRYFPNTSLYISGTKYRYVEYKYVNSRRIHQISAVDRSSFLKYILQMAEHGVKINELVQYLIMNEIPESDAVAFIDELIDSRIIIGENSLTVTGEDYLEKIIQLLNSIYPNGEIVYYLKAIKKQLVQLDQLSLSPVFFL